MPTSDSCAAVRQPALELAQPVELEARRTHDDRRIRAVGLERRERLDRLAEALLVGEERAALGEQIAHPGALERLQLAAEPGHLERRLGRGRQRHEAGRARVLLAHLLQQRSSASGATQIRCAARKPSSSGTQKGSARIAEGSPRVLVARAPARPPTPESRPVSAANAAQQRRVVAGRQHERRLLVSTPRARAPPAARGRPPAAPPCSAWPLR